MLSFFDAIRMTKGGLTGIDADDVIRVFGGGRILTQEEVVPTVLTADEWLEDAEGVWRRPSNPTTAHSCQHCSDEKKAPAWRRGGKIVRVIEPDGAPAWSCHFCGRRREGKKTGVPGIRVTCRSCAYGQL
jgi:hypothetical protein